MSDESKDRMSDVAPEAVDVENGAMLHRRHFLKAAGIAGLGLASGSRAVAAQAGGAGAINRAGAIPLRPFGRAADVKVSALGLGGHHLGDLPTVEDAISLVHEAVEGGITFFDNCWEYHNGKSENWMGRCWPVCATMFF